MLQKEITIALAGNPNSGKTSIFNALTGARQHVGNYPGVTVEKKEGTVVFGGYHINVIDLPGTYSLTAFSIEEIIARNYIVHEKPDVVVNVVDGSNLERNLYLTVQLLELRAPMVIALNMADELEKKGLRIDYPTFEYSIGCPVRPTVGHRGTGVHDILRAAIQIVEHKSAPPSPPHLHLGEDIDGEIKRLVGILEQNPSVDGEAPLEWTALKILEKDADVLRRVREYPGAEKILAQAERGGHHLRTLFGDDPEMVIAERRYGIISGIHRAVVRSTPQRSVDFSERLDRVLTNRAIGLPIFALFMYVTFWLVFTLGAIPMGWIETAFGWLGAGVERLWPRGSESLLKSLLVDGIIGGVGGVIVFLPNILLLFLAIAILEYTGYMARAAFIMDRIMKWAGFHGKSFIPMLTGFGCTVPAIMGTRCLDNQRDRLITILVLPLMSCGARFPIYALIIPAFFPPAYRANVLYGVYVFGIVLAILLARALRSTVFRGAPSPFVMELPPYRVPTLKAVTIYMWERARLYLRKAGTIILGVSIILWLFAQFPAKSQWDRDYAAEAAQARAQYFETVERIDGQLAGSNGGAGLAAYAQAQARMDEAGAAHWAHEAAYREAVRRYNEETAQSRRQYPALDRLLDAREHPQHADAAAAQALRQFDRARHAYAEALGEMETRKAHEQLRYSIVGRIGTVLSHVFAPAGFDWKVSSALVGALAAKEVFVSQLGIMYSMGGVDPGAFEDVSKTTNEGLGAALRNETFPPGHPREGQRVTPPLVAIAILLFCLVSAPCMATIAVTIRETNSWKWGLIQFAGLSIIGWAIAVAVYQVGMRLGLGI